MKQILMIIVVIIVLIVPARSADILQQQAQALETDKLLDELPEDAKKYMNDISPESSGDFFNNVKKIIISALDNSRSAWKKALRSAAIILLSVIICTLVSSFMDEKVQWAMLLVGSLTIGTCCFGEVQTMIGLGKATVEDLSVFTKLLLPVMAGAGTAAGCSASSNAIYTGTVVFLNILVSFINNVLVPLLYSYSALSLAACALEQSTLEGIKSFIAKFIKKSLQITLFLFSGYLSLTGIISGNADAMTVKATKMAVSSIVPVVGGMISDASETVIVSAKLLRNSVGIFGMLAVISIIIVPFIKLAIQYLILQATALLSTAVGSKNLSGLVDAMASAMGYILAMVGCCGLMTFISCICFMKVSVV